METSEKDRVSPKETKRRQSGDRWAAVAVFLLVFLVHVKSEMKWTGSDTQWNLPTAVSLVREGDFDIDEYHDRAVVEKEGYATFHSHGRRFNIYPYGAPLLSAPIVAVVDFFLAHTVRIDLAEFLNTSEEGQVEQFVACIWVAATAVVVFFTARLSLGFMGSLFLVFLFAFCSMAWSTASRALWTHTPSMFMIAVVTHLLARGRGDRGVTPLISIPLALAHMARQTNLVSVLLISALFLMRHPRRFPLYVLLALPFAVLHVWINWSLTGSLQSPYELLTGFIWEQFTLPGYGEGLLGTMVSPNRGLLIFFPLAMLSLAGGVVLTCRRPRDWLGPLLLGIIAGHWLLVSAWPWWWTGWSYGPRVFTDLVPYFIFLLTPLLATMREGGWAKRALIGIPLSVLAGWSLFVHQHGGTDYDALIWNHGRPNDSSYSWDWDDMQIFRESEDEGPQRQLDRRFDWYQGHGIHSDEDLIQITRPGIQLWVDTRGDEIQAEDTYAIWQGRRLRGRRALGLFDDGTVDGWTVSGDLPKQPADGQVLNQMLVEGVIGTGMLNTFDRLRWDEPQGTITSPRFVPVPGDHLIFLRGGGVYPETRVELLLGDQVVGSWHGTEHPWGWLRPEIVDLSAWVGEAMNVRVRDERDGGWASVVADHFVLARPEQWSMETVNGSQVPAPAAADRVQMERD